MIITDWDEVRRHFWGAPELAFDIETSGLSPWNDRVALVQLANREGDVGLVHCKGEPPEWLKGLLEHEGTRVIGHNVVGFDAIFMAGPNGVGLDVTTVDWYDTMVGEQAILPMGRRDYSASLAAALERRFRASKRARKAELDGPHSWMHGELTEEQVTYATNDVLHLIGLRERQLKHADELDPRGKLGGTAIPLEMAILPTTMLMRLNGMPIDDEAMYRMVREAEAAMADLAPKLTEALGWLPNMNSPVQLKRALNEVGIEVENTRRDTLIDLDLETHDPVARLILDYREASKFVSMYNEDFLMEHRASDGRVHPSFRQLGTDTGRYACVKPNLQQVPRPKRKMFVAPEGHVVVSADYSGLEIRVAAAVAQEHALMDALREADIHRSIASQMFGKPTYAISEEERFYAKRCVFTLLFGGSADRLYNDTRRLGGKLTEADAYDLVYRFFETYPGLKRERNRAYDIARHSAAYTIVLPTGHRRTVTRMDGTLKPATLLNTAVQGTAAGGLKMALGEVLNRGLAKHLSAVVHDEIVMVVPRHEATRVADELANAMLDGMRHLTACPMRIEVAIAHEWEKHAVMSWTQVDDKRTREVYRVDVEAIA